MVRNQALMGNAFVSPMRLCWPPHHSLHLHLPSNEGTSLTHSSSHTWTRLRDESSNITAWQGIH